MTSRNAMMPCATALTAYYNMTVDTATELERLQEEFNSQEDFIEVVVASTFGFPHVPEDKDNMSIEILAEVSAALPFFMILMPCKQPPFLTIVHALIWSMAYDIPFDSHP